MTEQVSKDGTRKRLYTLKDGSTIESVLMNYKDGRKTACISSQVWEFRLQTHAWNGGMVSHAATLHVLAMIGLLT